MGRRLVLLDVVAGHGRENLQHELEVGGAVVAATHPALLTRIVRRELEQSGDPTPDVTRRQEWRNGMDEALRAAHLL